VTPLLDVSGLRVEFRSEGRRTTIVDGVDFSVDAGEVLGLAGESGSGKTISMLALLGLLPPGATAAGTVRFDGRDLLANGAAGVRAERGKNIAMIFQDPMTSLHPMLSIERQLTDHARRHLGLSKRDAHARALELLEQVRMPNPARALRSFPHEFSGGMRQRISIAIALACKPRLLVADEPTTALDTTVQAGILRLLDELRREYGLAVVLITHDLGVVGALADRLAVMYAGRLVESGPAREVLGAPWHPYTQALIASLPDARGAGHALAPIPGVPPRPDARPAGCAFHPRCRFVQPSCSASVPALERVEGRLLACPVDPLRGGGS
jgi:oligopeptide/dipeptide ABC transporter ATP-binding protein